MNIELQKKVDLMIENFHVLKNGFRWEQPLVKHLVAMVHAAKGKAVNIEKLQEIRAYTKDETSWASYFRGTNEFIICNLLYFEENYKSFFQNMLKVYDKMKAVKFKNSPQLPLAAYTIVKEAPSGDWDYKINRMHAFYDKMKENHFWLTSSDDYVFAAVLACTDLSVEDTSVQMEQCYNYLSKEGFYKGNDLQTLSHILAIGEEEIKEKCNKSLELYNKLKAENCKLQYSGLATLGVLTLITSDIDKIVSEIKEVFDYIYEKDGYGFWSLDKSMRTILASTLVSDYYVDEIKKGVLQIALSNSINAIIIAQQQAAVAAICAASVVAASSSSS